MPGFINRQKNILDAALSSLGRRKTKNISLLSLYTGIVFILASLLFFVQALKNESTMILSDAPDLIVQKLMAGRHDLISLDRIKKIGDLRGVSSVEPRLWGYYFDPVFGGNITVTATNTKQVSHGEALIGQGVARTLRVASGDLINLRTYDNMPLLLTVREIFQHSSELVSADLIIIDPADFRALFNFPEGVATDLAVTVKNPREQATVAGKILEIFPDTRPILKREIIRTYDSLFDWRSGIVTLILTSAILSFIIFAWDKATGISAEERKEIGIFKAVGWETSDLLLMKFWEGAAISLTAFMLGSLSAYAYVFHTNAALFSTVLKGWSVIYPDFRLTPAIDPLQVCILFFLSVFPYAIATAVPSWMAASIDPDAAMRS